MRASLQDDSGSALVEFLLVSVVLTGLTLGVMQVGLALYVRNLVHDAAVEGAYHAALADVDVADGAARARSLIERTIGPGILTDATASRIERAGRWEVRVTVSATMPMIGLFGVPGAWEVTAYAPAEQLGR